MKSFKNAIKDICALIAYIGPLIIIGLDDFNIVFKVIIAGITFFYNALYHYRTSGLKQELTELKYNYVEKVKHYEEWQKKDEEYLSFYKEQLDIALAENEMLRHEIETYKKAGKT